MELIERYLAAVGRQLPAKQAADIEAELRDVLLTRVEEQEERLGRPVDRREVEALLLEFGNPLEVAGRYREVQYLVGPEIFPYWWAGLKITLGVIIGVFVVMAVLGIAAQTPHGDFGRLGPPLWSSLCIGFTCVTLAAAAIEYYPRAGWPLRRWRPSHLPPRYPKPHSAFDRTLEIAASVVFILWWLGVIRFSNLLPSPPYPDFLRLEMAPVWSQFKWWVTSYLVAEVAINLIGLARPASTRLNGVLGLLRHLYGAAILGVILQAGHFVVVSSDRIAPTALAIVQGRLDKAYYAGIVAAIALMLGRAGWEAWRMRRAAPARAEASRGAEGRLRP